MLCYKNQPTSGWMFGWILLVLASAHYASTSFIHLNDPYVKNTSLVSISLSQSFCLQSLSSTIFILSHYASALLPTPTFSYVLFHSHSHLQFCYPRASPIVSSLIHLFSSSGYLPSLFVLFLTPINRSTISIVFLLPKFPFWHVLFLRLFSSLIILQNFCSSSYLFFGIYSFYSLLLPSSLAFNFSSFLPPTKLSTLPSYFLLFHHLTKLLCHLHFVFSSSPHTFFVQSFLPFSSYKTFLLRMYSFLAFIFFQDLTILFLFLLLFPRHLLYLVSSSPFFIIQSCCTFSSNKTFLLNIYSSFTSSLLSLS